MDSEGILQWIGMGKVNRRAMPFQSGGNKEKVHQVFLQQPGLGDEPKSTYPPGSTMAAVPVKFVCPNLIDSITFHCLVKGL